ncbi:MAG: phosphotransferase family protein [Anaerolineae bacterium]
MTPDPLAFDDVLNQPMPPGALVAEAIEHFGLHVDSIAAVHESFSSTVRMITLMSGECMILKIPYVRIKLLRELRALEDLQDLPVATVLDAWIRDDGGPGAMLLSVLPGAPIRGLVPSGLAREMGELLARLHTHRLDHFGEVSDQGEHHASDWWEIMDARFEHWKPLCKPVMPDDLYRRTIERYAKLRADLPEPDGPCWAHYDYRPANILVDIPSQVDKPRITGLIDFESARGGSADLDFVKVSHRVWDAVPGTKKAFCEAYAAVRPVPDVQHTLPYYRLHNAFGGIAWCVRRTDTTDPFFRENMALLQHELHQ